jgi:hypothetical protein
MWGQREDDDDDNDPEAMAELREAVEHLSDTIAQAQRDASPGLAERLGKLEAILNGIVTILDRG